VEGAIPYLDGRGEEIVLNALLSWRRDMFKWRMGIDKGDHKMLLCSNDNGAVIDVTDMREGLLGPFLRGLIGGIEMVREVASLSSPEELFASFPPMKMNADARICSNVFEFCKYHTMYPDVYRTNGPGLTFDEIRPWDVEFMRVDNATLFYLFRCASEHQLELLAHICALRVASMIRGKTPHEVQMTFGLGRADCQLTSILGTDQILLLFSHLDEQELRLMAGFPSLTELATRRDL